MKRFMFSVLVFFLGACAVADDMPRTVVVSGVGSAEVEPDRATITMSIVAREKTLDGAQSNAAKVTASVLALCDRLDIDRDKVNSTGASVQPDYRWNRETEQQELRGYIAQRQIVVDVRDLEILGKVIEGAVAAGVNQVSPPVLDSGKRRDAYREALAHAAEDARANAAQLARSLGASLGQVITINTESSPAQPPVMRNMVRAMAVESDSEATYNAADLSFDATVTVTFALD